MFRRNSFRIINNQFNNFSNNTKNHFYCSKWLKSFCTQPVNKQSKCIQFLLQSFDRNFDSKINTIFNNHKLLIDEKNEENDLFLYTKYFESLVSQCQMDGQIHCLYDIETNELIGCALTIPFSSQTFSSSHWKPFINEAEKIGLKHIKQEMIDIESHFKQHITDIADENCYEEQFDTHVLEYIAIHPKYQRKGFGKRLLNLLSEEYKNKDSALILNTCNKNIANLLDNKLEYKVEETSEFKGKEMKWYSVPPVLHTYWNY